jgi:hypothetical protein
VIDTDVLAVLPAASSASTRIVFDPICSGMPEANHAALNVVPDRVARPRSPRSLDQRTRYRRLLSVAFPASPTAPAESMAVSELTETVGATES